MMPSGFGILLHTAAACAAYPMASPRLAMLASAIALRKECNPRYCR